MQLCIRAVNARAFGKATACAESLISAHPDIPDGYLLLGQALMHEEMAKFQGSLRPAPVSLDKKRLEGAEEVLTRAVDLAKALGDSPQVHKTLGGALFVRHQVRFMLGKKTESDADLEEAWRVQPHDEQVLIGRALVARRHSNALALKRLDDAGPSSNERVAFLRAEILFDLGRADEAIAELLRIAVANGPFAGDAVASVVEALTTRGRFEDADKLLHDSDKLPTATRKAIAAYIEFMRGNRELASKNALEAQQALLVADTPSIRRLLADVLERLGHKEESFEVLDSFVVRGIDSPDFKSLLRAAYLAGKHDLVLEACSKFTDEGMSDRFYVALECHVLQLYDPEGAYARLSKAIEEFPKDTELNFMYAFVALQTGHRAEAAKALTPDRIPQPETISAEIAKMIAAALLDIGRHGDAVTFAYAFLRKRWSEEAAHHVYVTTLANASEAPSEQPTIVGPDTAVCYRDEDGVDSWVVVERDGADVQLALSETTTTSPLGSVLAGKRVGDEFVLAAGVTPMTVKIVAIQNKYSFRLQDVAGNFQKRFPPSESVQSIKLPDDPAKLVSVGSPLFRAAVQREHYVRGLAEAYKSGRFSLCRLAEAVGIDPISCQLGLSGTVGVRCAIPEESFLRASLQALSQRGELFVDTSAMATIVLFDLLPEVSKLPWRLVTTNSSLDVLRGFVKQMRDERQQGGLGISDGTVSITERDPTFATMMAARAERLLSLLGVIDARPLASVEATRREQLEEIFGRWGAEAIACSAHADRILWTDDMLLAALAARLGAIPASTQAVVAAAVSRGGITAQRELEIGTALFTRRYEPLHVPDELLRHIAASSEWNVSKMPFAMVIERMKDMEPPDWLRVARIMASEAMLNLELPESRSAAVIAILETIRSRGDRAALLNALARSVAGLFKLQVIRENEFFEIIEAWAQQAGM